ncbi:ABC transporter substrate-binding protein [Dermatobacter hominis]|uniref:ABC transporter substrate-binding protein n=1 Tax=Dermatobacter hominis TaxID=2884263 RepID=UPI001D11D901|nr:ABC transporter substrate-binding protein [Dermatobacter hominis]UDY37374.1 ABC transporter substrate-binding protein [Dermatobacter hominis]
MPSTGRASEQRTTRPSRTPIAVALLLVLALVAAACGGSDDEGADEGEAQGGGSTTTEAGPWTFTDDLGVRVELDEAPETLVAETMVAGGLYELGIDVEGTFGPLKRSDGTPDPEVGLADPDQFTSLGETYGEINLEQLAALQPDLIITPSYEAGSYWGIDDADLEKVKAIAPVIGIKVGGQRIDQILDEVGRVGEALGAAPDSEQVEEAKAAFETSSRKLEEALAAKPGLKVLAASGSTDTMYIAVPSGYSDLTYYQSLGMDVVDPDTDEEYWQNLSWEEAGRYPADLILGDARTGATAEQIVAQMPESARQLPAIQADQLVPWVLTSALGYGAFAKVMDQLTTAVSSAQTGIA